MKKIKILSFVVVILLVVLSVHLYKTANKNEENNAFVKTVAQQKTLIQEISKNIFYISKNKDASFEQLERSIDDFLKNLKKRDILLERVSSQKVKKQADKILSLWKDFYNDVKKFKNQSKVITPYSSILLEKTVRDIYNKNLRLIAEIDKLLSMQQRYVEAAVGIYRDIQYALLALLLFLLIALFVYVSKINNDFDFLIGKIEKTIKNIQKIDDEAQEILQKNELSNEEDTVIEALDELIASSVKLKKLKKDLQNLKNLKSKN